jgi:hypothetical protein
MCDQVDSADELCGLLVRQVHLAARAVLHEERAQGRIEQNQPLVAVARVREDVLLHAA